MMDLTIDAMLSAEPFEPFAVCTADGRTYPVPHPEFAHVTPSRKQVVVYDANDRFSYIAIAHVVAVGGIGSEPR